MELSASIERVFVCMCVCVSMVDTLTLCVSASVLKNGSVYGSVSVTPICQERWLGSGRFISVIAGRQSSVCS